MLDLKQLGKLSGVERILLRTDGSMTDILEVLFGEIQVKLLGQEELYPPPVIQEIFQTNERLNHREVLISTHQKPLMYAKSYCDLSLLPAEAKKAIEGGEMPIGRVLAHFKLETRREILSVVRAQGAKEHSALFGHTFGYNGEILERRYIIYHTQKPLFYIKEVFAQEAFKGL